MSATAERYGTTPSSLLGIPPDPGNAWLRFCVDEALHSRSARHAWRMRRLDKERAEREDDDGDSNLFNRTMNDKRTGRGLEEKVAAALPTVEATFAPHTDVAVTDARPLTRAEIERLDRG